MAVTIFRNFLSSFLWSLHLMFLYENSESDCLVQFCLNFRMADVSTIILLYSWNFSVPVQLKLSVNSGSSSPKFGNRFALEKSWDNNPRTFFQALNSSNGWAKYNIPESNIKLVRLQNRASCCSELNFHENIMKHYRGDRF